MKTRTLLVDGSYLLERSYHGAKEVYNSKGKHLGALYGFMTKLRELVKKHMINKVIIFFDGQNSGIARHEICPAYKSNRTNKTWYGGIQLSDAEIKKENEKRESILVQKVRISQYCEELFLRQTESTGVESDDLISAYSIENEHKEELYIYTNDRDFAQLLDLNITIIFSNIETPINKTNYFFNFGHHYTNALIMKVIGGDTSDNIQGIKGIKEDILLKYFPDLRYRKHTVKEICQEAEKINKERASNGKKPLKVFENLLNNIDVLKMNYRLVNLREPFLTDEAREELKQLKMPLNPTNRGSKNLYKLMIEDEFLLIYKGTFPNYVEPFYTVIENEKQLLNEFNRKNKNLIK